jgi:hypothetical protein
MVCEPLETLEGHILFWITEQCIDHAFEDLLGHQQEVPVTNHKYSQVLPREGRLIEKYLQVRANFSQYLIF